MEPSADFWSAMIVGVLIFTLIGVVVGVILLKMFVFRPAEKRAKREADADGEYGPMERTELVSLIQKLDDRNEDNIVAREIAKNKFLADFREELVGPLSYIKNESSVLSQALGEQSGANAARGIHIAASKLESIILDLYELYTLEVGRARLNQESFPLSGLIVELETYFKSVSLDSGNTLEFKVGPQVREIVTDHTKLKKMLENLIESANSYTSHGTIKVDITYAEDGRLRFDVSDDGDGRKVEGRESEDWDGLRLPLVKKLAEFLGGGFEIKQSDRGAISTVHISARSS